MLSRRYVAICTLVLLAVILMVGTVGAYTKIAYVDYDANLLCNPSGNATYDDIHDCTTSSVIAPSTRILAGHMKSLGAGYDNFYDYGYRSAISADTTLPTGAVIQSATLTVSNVGVSDTLGAVKSSLIDFYPVGLKGFAANEYGCTTFKRMAADVRPSAGNKTFTLNADGLAAINTSGRTVMMFDNNRTVDDVGYVWAAGTYSEASWKAIEVAGYDKSIYFTIEYTYPLASGNYSFVHISDTQLLVQDHPETLNLTYDWIESNKGKYNITGVVATGDLTNNGHNETQWERYRNATLRTTVPMYETAGNHDYSTGDSEEFERWTGHGLYWNQTYGNFIILGSPNITPSAYNANLVALHTGTIAEYPGQMPLVLTHSFTWPVKERYHPFLELYNDIAGASRDFFVLSGHVNGNTWNRTYNRERSTYEGLLNVQSTDNVSVIVLYTVAMDGDTISKVWRRNVSVVPTVSVGPELEVYSPPDASLDLSTWSDSFTDETTSGYYIYPSNSDSWDTATGAVVARTTGSIMYNRVNWSGGNFTTVWKPVTEDGSSRFYGGLIFGKQSPQSMSCGNGNGYAVTLSNQSGTTQLTLFKSVDSSATALNHTHPEVILGTPYTITAIWDPAAASNNIEVYIDGTLSLTSDDTTFKKGYGGMVVVHGAETQFSEFDAEPIAPSADFTSDTTAGASPLSVQFTDLSTSPETWNWSYSNVTGEWHVFSTDQNPSYTFAQGVYDINLTVTNDLGSDTKTETGYIISAPAGYLVYFSGGEVIGQYPNGTVIASGAEGTSDGSVIKGVITNATAGSDIYFTSSGGTNKEFRTDGTLNVTKNLNLYALGNATFLWNTGTSVTNAQFSLTGSTTGTVNVTSDVSVGQSTVNVDSTTGIEAGDLVILGDRTVFNPLYSSTWNKSEIHKVESVGVGTVTFTDPTVMNYNHSVNTSRLTYISNPITVNMDGFYIYSTDNSTNEHSAIFTKYLVDSNFTNLKIDKTGQLGVGIYNGYNITVYGSTVSNLEMSGQGYAVSTADATAFVNILNNNFTTCRHTIANGGTGTSPGGQPRNITIENNFLTGYLIAASHVLDAHPETFSMTVRNNTIIHPYDDLRAYAVSLGTKHLTFTNNTLITNGTAMRDRVSMANCSWIIQNNTFITPRYGYYVQRYGYSDVLFSNDYSTWDSIYFHDNTITDGGALITVEMPPAITLLDTDALLPLAELSMTDTNASGAARSVSFAHTSFIKSDSRTLNIRNATGNNTALALPETSGAFSEPFHVGNWSVNLTATNEAGDNTSASFWVNVSEEAYIPTPTPTPTTTSSQPFSSSTGTSMVILALSLIGIGLIVFGAVFVYAAIKNESTGGLVLGIATLVVGAIILLMSYVVISPIMNLV